MNVEGECPIQRPKNVKFRDQSKTNESLNE